MTLRWALLGLLLLAPSTCAQAAPEVRFETDVDEPRVGQPVRFTDTSIGLPGAVRSWDFGDGGRATGLSVNHSYEDGGWFTVTLTVGNLNATREFLVTRAPVAAFEADPGKPEAGAPVVFIDRSYDLDDGLVSWSWDFGDGSGEGDRLRPEHTYKEPGIYLVVLTVRDAAGHEAQATLELAVAEPSGDPPKPNQTLEDELFTDYETPSVPAVPLAAALLGGAALLRRRRA